MKICEQFSRSLAWKSRHRILHASNNSMNSLTGTNTWDSIGKVFLDSVIECVVTSSVNKSVIVLQVQLWWVSGYCYWPVKESSREIYQESIQSQQLVIELVKEKFCTTLVTLLKSSRFHHVMVYSFAAAVATHRFPSLRCSSCVASHISQRDQ